MRILQIANGYLGNRLYKNLFSFQKKNGIQNTIYVPIANKENIPVGEPENVIISPCFSQLDRLLFFRKQKNMLKDLEKLDPSQYDLVHAHTVFSGGYSAYQLHKQYGLPYIVAVRNTDVNVFFKRMLHLRHVGVNVLRLAETVVFLSPAYRETVLEKYVPEKYRESIRAKSVVVPNGIDPLFFAQKGTSKTLTEGSLRLIYVGEINSNKNLELTVDAVKRLRSEGIDATLRAVGDISDESYRQLLQNEPFISYYQRCPLEQVLKHLRQADIFVMPSHTETFGLVYAEAMSQGLPVLYTRGQGFDGHFPDGTVGYAVSDTDSRELAEKIKAIKENYSVLSENCVQMAKRYEWGLLASQYAEMYQTICQGRKHPSGDGENSICY